MTQSLVIIHPFQLPAGWKFSSVTPQVFNYRH
jgi:hypothetical protein